MARLRSRAANHRPTERDWGTHLWSSQSAAGGQGGWIGICLDAQPPTPDKKQQSCSLPATSTKFCPPTSGPPEHCRWQQILKKSFSTIPISNLHSIILRPAKTKESVQMLRSANAGRGWHRWVGKKTPRALTTPRTTNGGGIPDALPATWLRHPLGVDCLQAHTKTFANNAPQAQETIHCLFGCFSSKQIWGSALQYGAPVLARRNP